VGLDSAGGGRIDIRQTEQLVWTLSECAGGAYASGADGAMDATTDRAVAANTDSATASGLFFGAHDGRAGT